MPLPSWFDNTKYDRQARNKRSGAQERKHAKERGGKVQRGSGSSWRAPQDVVTPDAMVQLKFTDAKQYALKATELWAVYRDANNAGRDAEMVIEFTRMGIKFTGTIEEI